MRKYGLVTVIALMLAGCMNNIEASTSSIAANEQNRVIAMTKQLVSDRMRDPEATRFKNSFQTYRTAKGDYIVCGTLNAKNAMGGYVGYKPFYARIRNNALEAFQIPSETDDYDVVLNAVKKNCSDAAAGKIMVSS